MTFSFFNGHKQKLSWLDLTRQDTTSLISLQYEYLCLNAQKKSQKIMSVFFSPQPTIFMCIFRFLFFLFHKFYDDMMTDDHHDHHRFRRHHHHSCYSHHRHDDDDEHIKRVALRVSSRRPDPCRKKRVFFVCFTLLAWYIFLVAFGFFYFSSSDFLLCYFLQQRNKCLSMVSGLVSLAIF